MAKPRPRISDPEDRAPVLLPNPPQEDDVSPWTRGDFMGAARGLARLLRRWPDPHPTHASRTTTEACRQRHEHILFDDLTRCEDRPLARPVIHNIFTDSDGKMVEAYIKPDEDEDKPLAIYRMSVFRRQLDQAPSSEGIKYLKRSFEAILRRPAFAVGGAIGDGRGQSSDRLLLHGREIPEEIIEALVDAAVEYFRQPGEGKAASQAGDGQPERLVIDTATNCVTLDGTVYGPLDPNGVAVLNTLKEFKDEGQTGPISPSLLHDSNRCGCRHRCHRHRPAVPRPCQQGRC